MTRDLREHGARGVYEMHMGSEERGSVAMLPGHRWSRGDNTVFSCRMGDNHKILIIRHCMHFQVVWCLLEKASCAFGDRSSVGLAS